LAQVVDGSLQEGRDESEERYRTLFDTLIEGFCTIEMIFDAADKPVDFRFLEINPAFERQTGLVHAQGKSMRELEPNLEEHWFQIYGKVALTGEAVHFENEAKALGRVYDVCAYRVGGPGSKKVAILFNDISARKLAEEKALAQLARLALLNQITRAIGERQDLTSIFQVVVGTLEEEMPVDFGCICMFDALDGILTVTCVGARSAALAAEIGIPEQARIVLDANGLGRCAQGVLVNEPDIADSRFPFTEKLARVGLRALVAAPLQVESRVFGMLIAARRAPHSFGSGECEFLRQASEHVALAAHQAETHAALQQAYQDLRQSQQAVMQQERLRALGEMASGIAHDINNAVSPVSIYTDSLLERETQLSPQGREQLQIIQRAVEDVAATVARMREFYRHREPDLALMPVSINRLVREVLDLTRARWSDMPQKRGIVIEARTELTPDVPEFMGVESEIREALTNLVFNAVDAMADGGTLTLRTGSLANGTRVYVEVRDSGVGMNEDTRQRCLEPFFTTKGERGTGLGLSMVYGTVQRHGGDIEIDSAVEQGTTMRLVFSAQTAVLALSAAPTSGRIVLPRLRILVIDDDPLLLKSLRDALEADGHQIVTANGGQEGINAFAAASRGEKPFDAVITDLGMPYVDGRKVAEAIKSFSRSTPVILLTGWGQRLIAEGDVPSHVDQVLSKPPKLRQLREALAQCCLRQ
jgi:PAS domain S-box-containing protein